MLSVATHDKQEEYKYVFQIVDDFRVDVTLAALKQAASPLPTLSATASTAPQYINQSNRDDSLKSFPTLPPPGTRPSGNM